MSKYEIADVAIRSCSPRRAMGEVTYYLDGMHSTLFEYCKAGGVETVLLLEDAPSDITRALAADQEVLEAFREACAYERDLNREKN